MIDYEGLGRVYELHRSIYSQNIETSLGTSLFFANLNSTLRVLELTSYLNLQAVHAFKKYFLQSSHLLKGEQKQEKRGRSFDTVTIVLFVALSIL